jgi:hypothetical protein
MGNAAVVEDGVGVDELEELGRLFASETAPEDDEDEEDDDEEEDDEDDDEPRVKPEGMPHE